MEMNINKTNSAHLKGIGILLIIFHNFFHLVIPNTPGENEFSFSSSRAELFFSQLINFPYDFTRILFSFWGHYGVQIFIFLSIYGLTKKYSGANPNIFPFLSKRFLKLYPAYVLSIVIFAIYSQVKNPDFLLIYWKNIILKLSLLSNFYPYQSLSLVGPWWFMSLIFQIYLAFLFLNHLYSKKGIGHIVVIGLFGLLIELTTAQYWTAIGLNINHTIFGFLPLICFAMIMSRREPFKINIFIACLALMVFLLSHFFNVAWLLSGLAFLIISLVLYFKILERFIARHSIINYSLTYLGANSLYLFLLNGFVRTEFLILAKQSENITTIIGLSFASLAAVIIAAELAKQIENKLSVLVKNSVAKLQTQ